jgi:lactate dehydrogenase-like 2-hydroxyacid dehydrogenase
LPRRAEKADNCAFTWVASDTILLSCGLGSETEGSIDTPRLALIKPINLARVAIGDEKRMYEALKDGRLGGAAPDAWWQ